MDVTTETVAPREIEFTIHPQAEQVEEARRKAARKVAQRVRIPGFRPGKAPYGLIERTVGKEMLTEEAAEILAPDLYKQILDEGGYKPFDRPTLRVTQEEPLELKIRVPLEPVVELADYCSMRVEPEPAPQATPEQVEKLVNDLREQHGTWVPVERAAQMGDQVTLDVKGTADGESVFDEKGTQLVLSETVTPPGFAEAIVGMEPGQAREFTLTYPQSHAEQSLAGKTVAFTATVKELKERRLPALDDEFARSVGDFASVEDLTNRLRERLQAQMEAEARDRQAIQVLDQVAGQSKVEFPNQAVEREIDSLVQQRESRLRQQGFTLESYLRIIHKSPAQLRDELRPEAEEDLRRSLVLGEVGRAEKIEVKAEEVMAEVNRMAERFGEQADAMRQMLMQQGALASVAKDVYSRQALVRLVDVVTGKVQGACAKPEAATGEAPAAGEQAPSEPAAE